MRSKCREKVLDKPKTGHMRSRWNRRSGEVGARARRVTEGTAQSSEP